MFLDLNQKMDGSSSHSHKLVGFGLHLTCRCVLYSLFIILKKSGKKGVSFQHLQIGILGKIIVSSLFRKLVSLGPLGSNNYYTSVLDRSQ